MSNVKAAGVWGGGRWVKREGKKEKEKHETPDDRFWKQALPWKSSGCYVL